MVKKETAAAEGVSESVARAPAPAAVGIFQAISAVMRDLEAIGKDRHADTGGGRGYKFRGIDDVYNEMHGHLARHGVFTVPRVLAERFEERQSNSGKTLIYRVLKVRYRFYAGDGSYVDAVVIGEGMDSGDKASNKAMAVAHKYALMQVFAIPTEDAKDPEVDAHHDVAPTFDSANQKHVGNVRGACKAAGLTADEFRAVLARLHGGPATDTRVDEMISAALNGREPPGAPAAPVYSEDVPPQAPPVHASEARVAGSNAPFSKDHIGHREWLKKMLAKKPEAALLSEKDRDEIATKLDGFAFTAIGDAWTEWLSESDLRKTEMAAIAQAGDLGKPQGATAP